MSFPMVPQVQWGKKKGHGYLCIANFSLFQFLIRIYVVLLNPDSLSNSEWIHQENSVNRRMPTERSCYQSLRAALCNIGELRVVFCLRTKWGDLSLKSPKPTTVDKKGSQSALLASQIYSLQLLSLTTARCLGLETTWYRKENTDKAKPITG